jgi:hypothetical protein
MDYEARKDDIAREVAKDLSSEFGPDLLAETEKRLAPGEQGTRAFGVSLSDAAAAAGLLIGCIQLVLQYYSDKRMDKLIESLETEAPRPVKVSAEKRSSIIRRVVEKFTGSPKP